MQWAEPEVRAPRVGAQKAAIGLAVVVSAPGLVVGLSGDHPSGYGGIALFGLSIVAAAFLLAWAAEALQLDVSQGLALALLALIAVLPEYVVDFTFASKAGENPEKYAPLALANMTGSNRLLIGVGWTAVVLIAAWRIKHIARSRGYEGELDTDVHLDRSHSIEIGFLAVATIYSLTLPLKSHLTLFDSGVLVLPLRRVRLARSAAPRPRNPISWARPGSSARLPTARRRTAVIAHAGLRRGRHPDVRRAVRRLARRRGPRARHQHLPPRAVARPAGLGGARAGRRLPVRLAPQHERRASAPSCRRRSTSGRCWSGRCHWCSSSSGGASSGLPLDQLQREELFLTAAQSAFAVAILANRSISVREAWSLFTLFIAQFVLGAVLPSDLRHWERLGVGIVYLVLAGGILLADRRRLPGLLRDGFRTPVNELAQARADPEPDTTPST